MSSLDEADFLQQQNSDQTINLLLLANKPLHLTINLRFHRVPSQSYVRQQTTGTGEGATQPGTKTASGASAPLHSPVLIYFHGGGWMADFRASHLHFLSEWSTSLSIPILYVNYSLSPDNCYPTALNECYDVYRWVVEGHLGVCADKIILIGDSTGGNLAAACCMKAIIDKVRIPDAVILACPILNLRLTPTPSRSLYMMDAVLPMNLLLQCRSLYLANPTDADTDTDPCLSPIVATDVLLQQWPSTSIVVGGFDPFVDDSVDFAHRLAYNGRMVRLKIYDSLPHSFWDFAPILPEAQQAVDLAAKWIEQECQRPTQAETHTENSK